MPDLPLGPRPFAGGRYTLLEAIGHGGMATVWRARDNRLRVDRAVKVLLKHPTGAKTRARRLDAEARAMAKLNHRHIVKVHDIGESEEGPFVVMDFLPGGTLDDRLRADGSVPARHAARWMMQILTALEAAHNAGIVHRDVKPSNVLIDEHGDAQLADFGIALLADDERHTRTNISMGSVAFMAPEQRIDARSVGPEADVYAAAATLYNLVSGSTPVDLFTAEMESPRWMDVPLPLVPILHRATRHDRLKRYPTANALREAIAEVEPQLTERLTPPLGGGHVSTGTVQPLEAEASRYGHLPTLHGGGDDTADDGSGLRWVAIPLVLLGLVAVATSWLLPAQTAVERVPLPVVVDAAPAEPAPSVEPTAAPAFAPPAVDVDVRPEAAPAVAPQAPAPAGFGSALEPADRRPVSPPPASPAAVVSASVPPPGAVSVPKPAWVVPPEWRDFEPKAGTDTRSVVTGRWEGSINGADRLYLALDGADGQVRGTAWVQMTGGVPQPIRCAGRYDEGTRILELKDVEDVPGAGRYKLSLSARGDRLIGAFERPRPVDGQRTVQVSVSRR